MRAFLFGWNPIKFAWENINEDIKTLASTGKLDENWSVAGHKTIRVGDRAYIVRVGVEPKGIFASGYVSSEPFPAYRNGRQYFRVTVTMDVLLNPDEERILTLDILKTGKLASQTWTPQASGISIKPDLVDELEGLWFDFLENRDSAQDY